MCKTGYEHRLAKAQTRTRAPNRRDCRRESPAHRHDATTAAGGSTCPTSRDGWPDCPVLHDGGCREWKGRASQTRRMALPFALAGFCSAAGTPARAFNAIPCRRVPNRPRSAWWWRERRLCQIRRIRTQWALSSGPARLGAMLCWVFSVINANSCTSCRRFWLPVASC